MILLHHCASWSLPQTFSSYSCLYQGQLWTPPSIYESFLVYLRFLERKANSQQQGWLFNVVVLVAEDSYTTRFHHQTEREGKVVAQPALCEGSRSVAVCNQHNVLGLTVVHMRRLNGPDLLDQDVKTSSELSGRSSACERTCLCVGRLNHDSLATFATISPNVPFLLSVEAASLAQCPDLFGYTTFIVSYVIALASISKQPVRRLTYP